MNFLLKIALLPLLALLPLACSVRQQNLTIKLAETPLYPPKNWAVVKMPYIKVNEKLDLPESLLGMVRLGEIVEVQRIEQNPKNKTMWAFIVSSSSPTNVLQGWVPYSFLHMVGNHVEGELASRQISKPNMVFLDPKDN